MPKYDQLSNQLRVRILHGDYAMRSLPPERQLAVEHGVSYMTARRALQHLIDDGVLKRAANGRVEVDTRLGSGSVAPVFALLSPAFSSAGFDLWRQLLSQSVEALGGRLRQELYTHWDDPIFAESRTGFQGVFLLPSSEKMPAAFIQNLAHSERPLVVLDDDLSEQEIPSLRRFSPLFVHSLLDHLQSLGCRRIACLNVQPLHSVIEQYIEQWQKRKNLHAFAGDLINHPVEPYAHAFTQAYKVMKSLLASGDFQADALFCVTAPAAIGAVRAMHEAGVRPGYDVAVCTTDGEGVAEFQIPSLTALELHDPTPHIKNCIHWMLKGGGQWDGPLLMEPVTARLQIRESTDFFVSQ
jgi:hypothetical protein